MGVARLLAKAWFVFCLFAAAYAFQRALAAGVPFSEIAVPVCVCAVLFCAMGLLFVVGFGASASPFGPAMLNELKPDHFIPGFNEIVFLVFAVLIFAAQTAYLPTHADGGLLGTLRDAVGYAVPGQGALEDRLTTCGVDGGRLTASAVSWLLAFIFLGSSLSHVRLAAGILRLERTAHPEPMGLTTLTYVLGIAAVIMIQLFFVGSIYGLLPCDMAIGLTGELAIGLGPLTLAYLIGAAITDLLALGPEA
jgi:hypothetical protein